jgi:hypothetical protein
MAVAVTGGTDRHLCSAARPLRLASVARPRQRNVEFALDHGMDEFANLITQARFDRINPGVLYQNALVATHLRRHGRGCHDHAHL